MHQTRNETTKKLPIPRKGTKYIARPSSHKKNSVPIVIAIRDMLKLARTSKEVQSMINSKLLKINNREVKDKNESVKLFNLLQADKLYTLTLTQNGRFDLEPTPKAQGRFAKIINKSLIKNSRTQLHLHDGTNIISEDKKLSVNDTISLSFGNKIEKHIPFEKDSKCFIISGKYAGHEGKILAIHKNQTVDIKLEKHEGVKTLEKRSVIVI